MSEWRPVEDGLIHRDGEIEMNVEGNELTIRGSDGIGWIPLPGNLRICERVPDEPITTEALKATGWLDISSSEYDMYIAPLTIPHVEVKFYDTITLVTIGSKAAPSIVDMGSLSTLVRILGGPSTLVRILGGGR